METDPVPIDDYPLIATMPPPGLARRQLLRAAHLNLTIDDFTAEERADRGFPPASDPAAAEI